ncbi:hypothetical protein IA929_03965 [Listeria seeligeri]|uniref:T7SS effector LXG polymorphic toxin n=1 Tax=Listeria seeligeri TaxID=1640 RepID=UPI001887D7B3|nr:T7SS effector LXG polymorphic toxin [Listeria seeligeri]MBF2599157.1 hypothetical protein [Listeria seeligeri]
MKIDVRELSEIANNYIIELNNEHELLTDAISATTTFATETQEFFKGKTADASRAYLQEAYKPVQQKMVDINREMAQTLQKYRDDAQDQFGMYGIVDIIVIETEYKKSLNQITNQEMDTYQELNNLIYEANEFISFPTSNLGWLEELHFDALSEITKIRMKMEEFETKWNTEFKKIEILQDELERMLAQVESSNIMPTSYKTGMIKFMNTEQQALYDKLPQEFKDAIASGFATIEDFQATDDGFIICTKAIGTEGYADWYSYCIQDNEGKFVFGLCKLRTTSSEEVSHMGIVVSFSKIGVNELKKIFSGEKTANEFDESTSIYQAIYGGKVDTTLLSYFCNENSQAGYLISDIFVQKVIKTRVNDNKLIFTKEEAKYIENNMLDYQLEKLESLGCYKDGIINLNNTNQLSENEYTSLLLAFTANTSIYSFAAEVQTHALGAQVTNTLIQQNEAYKALNMMPPTGLFSGILESIYNSGRASDSAVGESGKSFLSNWGMDNAFGKEDAILTEKQKDLHKEKVDKKHGW